MREVLNSLKDSLRFLSGWVDEGYLQVPYVLDVIPIMVVLQIPNNKQCTLFNLVVISADYSRSGGHSQEDG